MTYKFLLELLSQTINNLGIQEENRNFELVLDMNSYKILNNDLSKFVDLYTAFSIEVLKTPLGVVDIKSIQRLKPYIKLELK